MRNLGGLVFTIPYKVRACALADELGPQARAVGAINALARGGDGRWRGDIFDGMGCVEAFRRRGIPLAGKRVMLIGAGGAGSAIAVAIGVRAACLAHHLRRRCRSRASARAPRSRRRRRTCGWRPERRASTGSTSCSMRHPSACSTTRACRSTSPRCRAISSCSTRSSSRSARRCSTLAQRCGCTIVQGREMMRGQIARMVDFFFA